MIEFSPLFVSVLVTSDRQQRVICRLYPNWIRKNASTEYISKQFVLSWFISMLHCYFNNFCFLRKLRNERRIPFALSFCYFHGQLVLLGTRGTTSPLCKLFRGLVAGTSPFVCADLQPTYEKQENQKLLLMEHYNNLIENRKQGVLKNKLP